MNLINDDFKKWINAIVVKYKQSQIKAAIKVNHELLMFYYELGREISSTSYKAEYGNSFYENLSKELIKLLPNTRGLSTQNLRYMEKFYNLYSRDEKIFPQLVGELFSIPWGHHRIIIDKCKTFDEAIFFVRKTLDNNWSRSVLQNFLETKLFEREGKAITNFSMSLPEENSELAQAITKDPYNFDFLAIKENYNEMELKNALMSNIQKYLLELGKGFAFIGKENKFLVGEKELFTDLLFYHIKLRAYVVIEVKVTDFDPTHLGQLSAYVSAVNHTLKDENDNPTIGLLICKNKDSVLAKYSLENYNVPLGVSEYELSNLIPTNFKSSLPSIEEIEKELQNK